jgi:predicted Zn-dependent protease
MGQLGNAMYELEEYHEQGNAVWARSNDLLEQAAPQPGASPALWGQLATFRAEQKRYADAERAFAEALKADPNKLEWRIGHANALAELGRLDEAIAEATKIIIANPADAGANDLLGRLEKRKAAPK